MEICFFCLSIAIERGFAIGTYILPICSMFKLIHRQLQRRRRVLHALRRSHDASIQARIILLLHLIKRLNAKGNECVRNIDSLTCLCVDKPRHDSDLTFLHWDQNGWILERNMICMLFKTGDDFFA